MACQVLYLYNQDFRITYNGPNWITMPYISKACEHRGYYSIKQNNVEIENSAERER